MLTTQLQELYKLQATMDPKIFDIIKDELLAKLITKPNLKVTEPMQKTIVSSTVAGIEIQLYFLIKDSRSILQEFRGKTTITRGQSMQQAKIDGKRNSDAFAKHGSMCAFTVQFYVYREKLEKVHGVPVQVIFFVVNNY